MRWFALAALAGAVACAPSMSRSPAADGEAAARAAVARIGGEPERRQEGRAQPIEIHPRHADDTLKADPDCPRRDDALTRAERGSSCATYEAEVAALVGRCVAQCDADAVALETLRLSQAACADWCTSKGCGRASFIPPPDGCAKQDCFFDTLQSDCRDARCQWREYCSLIDTNRVWNCFCRDVIEP